MREPAAREEIFGDNIIKFQKFGVKIGIRADRKTHLKEVSKRLERVFTRGFEFLDESDIEYYFEIRSKKGSGGGELYRNGEKIGGDANPEVFFNVVESQIRLTVGEFAVGKVFLHAGVVGWKGRAIVIPATSFSGKSTLTAALVRKGAEYYSDEYAVLDAEGKVEPFPKWLSLRGIIDPWTQLDCPVEDLGGRAGVETIPVGLILIARYRENKPIPKKWRPKKLRQGEAIMEILPHTLPIRNRPEFVLEVLNKLTKRAIIVKTVRGEAPDFAETLLNYLDLQT